MFRIFGRIIELESGRPIPDLMVTVFDQDRESAIDLSSASGIEVIGANSRVLGQRLGTALTDSVGRFELQFQTTDFAPESGNDGRPDLLISVFAPLTSEEPGVTPISPPDRLLHFSAVPITGAGNSEGLVVRLRREQLVKHRIGTSSEQGSEPGPPLPVAVASLGAIFGGDAERQRESRAALLGRLNPALARITEARKMAQSVARRLSSVPVLQDTRPFFVRDTGTQDERLNRTREAISSSTEAGLLDLSEFDRSPVAIRLDPSELLELLHPGTSIDDLPVSVNLETLCGLIHHAAGGYSLSRTRSLLGVRDRLEAWRAETEEPPPSEGEDGGEASSDVAEPTISDDVPIANRIMQLVEAQVADLATAPGDGSASPPAGGPWARLRADLEAAELAAGPADTTAYHDFHTLQMAYPAVWVEALNWRLRDTIESLYATVNEVAVQHDLEPDAVLTGEIQDLKEFLDEIRGFSESVTEARMASFTEAVGRLWPWVEPFWSHLLPGEAAWLVALAGQPFVRGGRDGADTFEVDAVTVYDSPLPIGEVEEMERRRGLGEAMLARIDFASRTSTATRNDEVSGEVAETRLFRLLNEAAAMLTERYAFEYFAPNSTNVGIVVTYRQRWEPGSYQVGDMVSSVPLAPNEVRRFSVKETRKTTRAIKELERSMWSRSGSSQETSRITNEIVRRAEASTNFSMTAQGSFDIGIGSLETTTQFARNQKTHSESTKKDFHEAVIRASHEFKNERTLEVITTEEEALEAATSGELRNPNNELTVTYLLYELERQYRVSEQIHQLQPVILVAQEMPGPGDITEAWLLRYEWILRRVLLDDSLLGALDNLHNALVGQETSISVKRANWEAQLRIVENLEGEHARWQDQRRELNRQLVAARYRERVAEAAENAGGLLSDLGSALVGFDPRGMTEDQLEARRKLVEDQLKWVEQELAASAEKLEAAREAFNVATKALTEALEERTQGRTLIDQLRIHVKDNILYYMQAVWSHEPPDQRYFRLHNVEVFFPSAGTSSCRVRAADPGEEGHPIPGLPGRNYVIDSCSAPTTDPDDPAHWRPLHEVAHLDKPVGFKGNYMIFPMLTCNLITDYMMLDYVDSYFGIRDPDEFAEFTTDELIAYRRRLDADERRAMDTVIAARLDGGRGDGDTVVLPTGQFYMEALVGSHTLLEPFKLAHRGYDAASAREALRERTLENLRYASRLVAEPPLLDDPDSEKRVDVRHDGSGRVDVDVDV